jgi:hypothetical protein
MTFKVKATLGQISTIYPNRSRLHGESCHTCPIALNVKINGHPRSYVHIIRKWIGIASGIYGWRSHDLGGQGLGHSRSDIDYIRKLFWVAWGVFPKVSHDTEGQRQGQPRWLHWKCKASEGEYCWICPMILNVKVKVVHVQITLNVVDRVRKRADAPGWPPAPGPSAPGTETPTPNTDVFKF